MVEDQGARSPRFFLPPPRPSPTCCPGALTPVVAHVLLTLFSPFPSSSSTSVRLLLEGKGCGPIPEICVAGDGTAGPVARPSHSPPFHESAVLRPVLALGLCLGSCGSHLGTQFTSGVLSTGGVSSLLVAALSSLDDSSPGSLGVPEPEVLLSKQ